MSFFGTNSQFSPINKDETKKPIVLPKSTMNIKQIVNKSPFTYGAKKVSFSVKPRTTFWEPYINSNQNLDNILKRGIINSILNNSTDSIDDFYNKPVSPVLALTLMLLNKNLFNTDIFYEYMGDPKDTTHSRFKPKVYAKSTSYVDESNTLKTGEPEAYRKSLPSYYHIHGSYINSASKSEVGTAVGGKLYDDETNEIKEDINNVYTNIGYGISGITKDEQRALRYLLDEGLFYKLSKLPYKTKSSDINVLRDGYGYGPICISAFLNLIKTGKKILPDIICGLLVSEDSGMTIRDAVAGIKQWLNPGNRSYGVFDLSPIRNLSVFKVLEIFEEIGTYYFLSLLGHTFKKNIHFNIPLTHEERNIFEVGYLMGDVYSDLTEYMKQIITQGLFKQKSIEVFSIYTPCVMTADGTVSDSVLEMGDYKRNFGDLTTMEDNPLTRALGVKKCLDDIEDFDYLINPLNNYTTNDFINKDLATNYINLIDSLFTSYYKPTGAAQAEPISNIRSEDQIEDSLYIDHYLAPRDTEGKFDESLCAPIYDNRVLKDSSIVNTYVIADGISSITTFKMIKLLKDNNFNMAYYYRKIKDIDNKDATPKRVEASDDGATALTQFFDLYGLAIIRIVLINSFCNSYSLSLATQTDLYRRFFNVFTGLIEDFVDIKVYNLK